MSLRDELLELEHAGWRSLCEGTGGDFYGRTMAERGLMVLVDGSVLDRDAVAASLSDAPRWASYEITEPRLLVLGDDAASLVYTGTARREQGDDFVASMASTYVREGGGWRLALYQQTLRP
ncbi:nuclear transport factor 2 family protein [Agrococcus baldri]|uniref:DUF4440 domain-containing protein n=1 Tax=Agrococcus baldri TaxID=153730 RepID=A0AA87UQQ1_9MICO|nr:nuclear transport factor 2 family protein [Agrococcus baldri]GEK78734.1 hypothetical protein ABA31_00850 [Agrococcus baldri]